MRTLDDVKTADLQFLNSLPVHDDATGAPKHIRKRQSRIRGYFVSEVEVRDMQTHSVYRDKKAVIFVDNSGFTVRMRNRKAKLFNKYSWFYASFYDISLARSAKKRLELVDGNNGVGFFFTKKKAIKFFCILVDSFQIRKASV